MTEFDNVIINRPQFTNNSAVVGSVLTNLQAAGSVLTNMQAVDCGTVNQDVVIELHILGRT